MSMQRFSYPNLTHSVGAGKIAVEQFEIDRGSSSLSIAQTEIHKSVDKAATFA